VTRGRGRRRWDNRRNDLRGICGGSTNRLRRTPVVVAAGRRLLADHGAGAGRRQHSESSQRLGRGARQSHTGRGRASGAHAGRASGTRGTRASSARGSGTTGGTGGAGLPQNLPQHQVLERQDRAEWADRPEDPSRAPTTLAAVARTVRAQLGVAPYSSARAARIVKAQPDLGTGQTTRLRESRQCLARPQKQRPDAGHRGAQVL
jgi:hypothetical protein